MWDGAASQPATADLSVRFSRVWYLVPVAFALALMATKTFVGTRTVMSIDLPWLTDLERPTRARRIPSLFTVSEVTVWPRRSSCPARIDMTRFTGPTLGVGLIGL